MDIKHYEKQYKDKKEQLSQLLSDYRELLEIKELFKSGYAKELLEKVKSEECSNHMIQFNSYYVLAIQDLIRKNDERLGKILKDRDLMLLEKYREENHKLKEENSKLRQELNDIINITKRFELQKGE